MRSRSAAFGWPRRDPRSGPKIVNWKTSRQDYIIDQFLTTSDIRWHFPLSCHSTVSIYCAIAFGAAKLTAEEIEKPGDIRCWRILAISKRSATRCAEIFAMKKSTISDYSSSRRTVNILKAISKRSATRCAEIFAMKKNQRYPITLLRGELLTYECDLKEIRYAVRR